MIRIQNLCKKYRRLEALRDLTLHVPEGSAFALVGANGAGKTTTLKILLNLIRGDSGKASIMDTDSRRLGPAEFRRIGYVSENQRLPEGLTVDQYFRYVRPMYPDWDRQLETALRNQFHFTGGMRIGNLSHGMRLKLSLACALAFRPKLLVLDEPLGGLDPLARDEVMEGLLAQAGETTVLISSHELAEIEGTLTHVAYLERGRLVFAEPLADLSNRFREIHVTLPEGSTGVATQPQDSWFGMRQTGATVQFVDTRFDEATLGERVRAAFGEEVHAIRTEPMGLRSIFVALAERQSEGVS